MKSTLKLRQTVLGTVLLLAALGSTAMTLGRTRGAVLIGRPLDLTVEVRLDAADTAVPGSATSGHSIRRSFGSPVG